MTSAERAELIELLDSLGAESDAAVLATARALHRKATESGLSWRELLDVESDEPEESADEPAVVESMSGDNADALRQIDRILRKGVSDTLREDLAEMKRNIADGSFDAMDRRYVRALAKRLGT